MGCNIRFFVADNYVELSFSGQTEMSNIIEAFEQVLNDPRYQSGIGFLTNFLDAHTELSIQGMEELKQFAIAATKAHTGYRSALLISDEMDRYYGQLWGAFSAGINREDFKVFECRDDAVIWLTEQPQQQTESEEQVALA
ncbi:hypothetical protein [Pleionea sp. CnH1-48]|uniref:hypothetical protein n=1 Tax=Pleionea sp. CnH1-48 TaxID=2954494 RepID=UPI00209762FC|nr:hypothetical protein [Pleionea sp. CnH1-48]MCO7222908.1 hypothetical protein [Pleionea sp. CnH1-48]